MQDSAIVGFIFLFILKKDTITELPPLILPNTGNMGVPICLFAYGTEGLGVASAIASVIILFHFTIGVLLAKKVFIRYFSKKRSYLWNYYCGSFSLL